jgi:acetyl-CoA carboxylase biotin carboxyl carrier protein
LDLKELKEILQILEEKEITEFELEEEGMKLRIRKASPSSNHAAAPAVVVAPFIPAAPPSAPSPLTSAPAAAPAPAAPVEVEATDVTVVKSPIVGTFYRTPDPNSPPFVDVGDRIRVGQVLCIIEAMKLMNEIEAEVAGEVLKVHRETGQPVQYGDPLFTVRPDR